MIATLIQGWVRRRADAVPDAPEMVWILDAESYTSRLMPAVHQWTEATTFSGYSGASYMNLAGGNGTACVTNVSACASMTYAITLLTGGTYHFHARMYANPGGSTDSVWVSVDDPAAAALANVAVMWVLRALVPDVGRVPVGTRRVSRRPPTS